MILMSIFEDVMLGNKPEIITENVDTMTNEEEVYTEATYTDSLPYLRVMNRHITLPKGTPTGKGNLCFLCTSNTDESFKLMKSNTNFINGNKYYFYFYNMIYRGRLFNKTYRIKNNDIRKSLYTKLKKETNIHPYLKMNIQPEENRNMYFDLSKYLEIFNNITKKLSPNKRITLFWEYIKNIIISENYKGYSNKFILINIDNFKITKKLEENLSNPVFMIYFTLFRNFELIKDINMDIFMFTGNKCLRFNPSMSNKKTYIQFKSLMTKLYSSVPIKQMEEVTNEDKLKKDEATIDSVETINKVITFKTSDKVIENNEIENKVFHAVKPVIAEKIQKKVDDVRQELEEQEIDVSEIPQETISNVIQTRIENDIDSDKELLNEIYNDSVVDLMPKSAASTARDKELQKKQEEIKVNGLTIKEIEKIQAEHIKIPVKDVSDNVKTTNKNMTKLTFHEFEKTYNEKIMSKDIVNSILSLNNKSIPMYVRDIKIKDTSDELNYKDTYTILLEDANRKRHTIKVDLPKFLEDKFMYIGGNKKIIKKQNLLYPVVKTSSDVVQITTNYNKMFIYRVGTKSISSIEKLKSALKKSDGMKSYFTFGNSLSVNNDYITTIEYDELSKMVIEYKNGKTHLFFDQINAKNYADKHNISMKKDYLFIGVDNLNNPVYINNKSQKTDDNKSIIEIILYSFNSDLLDIYNSVKPPKRLMYARAKVMEQFVSLGILVAFWEGITTLLKKGNVKYRLEDKLPKDLNPNESVIKFLDCYLVYTADIGMDLLLNGIKFIDTSVYKLEEMDTPEPYMSYLIKVYGKASIANALMNVYEFMIDPITKEVLTDLNLPTDLVGVIIYATSLLSDSQFTPEINQNLSRIRSNEIIPAILYEQLAKKYILYRNSNGKKSFSVPQDCVIKKVLALKTVEDYSTLNPVLELEMSRGISNKGFMGVNLEDSYTMEKRTYDPTSTGIIAPSSSPDGQVGVNKSLSLNPTIKSIRGYVDVKNNKLDELNDTNLFSPAELTIPLAATRDDPTRLGHAIKQSKHVIPVKNSSPVLMSNGMEEVCRFELSSDFVVNADEDGTVVDYDDNLKIMIVKYKSGKTRAVNLGKNIVKNGGGGFFLSNELITPLKVGDKFKKNDVLAYHKDFFTNDKFNNCRMNMGTLSKVAIMSTYDTYQDATMITEKLSDDAATEMCFVRQVTIGKNANVEYIVKKGDEIKVGDSLIQFDTSYEDESLNKLLASLSENEQESVLEGSKNDIHSKYSGVIEEIKIYSTVEVDELSPSLKKIVKNYYNNIEKKKKILEQYDPDSKESIVKCGLLFNETTKKIEPNKFGVIKGQKIEDGVMIEFYIKHSEPLEIGSKIANFTALKNTIAEIIPSGYEPWSSYRPEEEISTIIASNSILKRMTPSILLTALGNKCIIELKHELKKIFDEKE